jgi:hypothetical protein
MLLQIDGWWGGGKSLLSSLLDGHPEIKVTPIHDAAHMAFLSENDPAIFENKDLNYVRRIIASKSEYYNLEKFSRLGYRRIAFSKDVLLRLPMDFDFYTFDKKWIDTLLDQKIWTEEVILDTLYQTLGDILSKNHSHSKYVASLSWPRLGNQETFFRKLPNAKNILIKRPVIDVIATRSGRKPMEHTLNNHFAPGFEKIINSSEIEDIMDYYAFWQKQHELFPKQVYVTEMNRLIHDRESEMTKIAAFLDIEMNDCLLKSTFLGNRIEYNGVSYADQVFDNAAAVFSTKELELVIGKINAIDKKKAFF